MTLTIEFSPEAQARLEAEAERRGVSVADLIVALAEEIPEPSDTTKTSGHRLGFIGIGASGRTPFDIHKERDELAVILRSTSSLPNSRLTVMGGSRPNPLIGGRHGAI